MKIGEEVVVNTEDYSFWTALEAANHFPEAEVFSDLRICYAGDGCRTIEEVDRIIGYNIDQLLENWQVVNLAQARRLFPQYDDYFKKFDIQDYGEKLLFLVSSDFSFLRLVSETNGFEYPMHFNDLLQSRKVPWEVAQDLANLRSSFEWFSNMVEQGYAATLMADEKYHIGHWQTDKGIDSLNILLGYPRLSFEEALKIAKEPNVIKAEFAKDNFDCNKRFDLLYDGTLLDSEAREKLEGIVRLRPARIYKEWGAPFSKKELAKINGKREFCYTELKGWNNKVNYLRFPGHLVAKTQRQAVERAVHVANHHSCPNRSVTLTGSFIMK